MPIQLTNSFVRQYRQLTVAMQRKVDKAPMSLDLDYVSARGIFEAYVDVKYRMTFERHNDTFVIRNVDNHDECLRNP
jgi:hypothetical protein